MISSDIATKRISTTSANDERLKRHVVRLLQCRRCPRVVPPPVSGGAIVSDVMLIGQAPGVREPVLKRPFAHTAGKTLFRWFHEFCSLDENTIRNRVYFAAVIRCFPGKAPGGGDRVPSPVEIRNCSGWMNDEIEYLRPRLVIPVGRLAIAQFIAVQKLDEVIGRKFKIDHHGVAFDLIPLPHPSGASPWHKMSPGRELLAKAMRMIANHDAIRVISSAVEKSAEMARLRST
ncbi:MAG: uracil-DNA glycosylase family protein [Chthoniobacterales bacterium]